MIQARTRACLREGGDSAEGPERRIHSLDLFLLYSLIIIFLIDGRGGFAKDAEKYFLTFFIYRSKLDSAIY